MMNLTEEIKNIPVRHSRGEFGKYIHYLHYEEGFKDALAHAAELSLKTQARVEELEEMLSRLVKENDLAMPNEKYQWMYSPMRAECLEILKEEM